MPIDSWIEKDKKRIHAVVYGEFSVDDIFETIEGATNKPDYEIGFNVLSDHTKITKPITIDQMKRMVFKIIQLSKQYAGTKWAVVTNQEISKKMMMETSDHLKRVPMELAVFESIDDAEKWLDEKQEPPNKSL